MATTQAKANWTARRTNKCRLKLLSLTTAVVTLAAITFIDKAGANSRQSATTVPVHSLTLQARQQTSSALLKEGENLVRRGEVKRALSVYAEAEILNSPLPVSAGDWNTLCWFGSLWGQAADVIDACNKAIELAPKQEEFRDSRGLARALSGDIEGAIEDFQVFVDTTEDQSRKYQRQSWINSLRRGQNPFTPEQIKQLFVD
ncbi:tetratricopeptide repeat protein [Microcoleus sp. FACHB-672]|uniref:tetratricopeptide repeat protein n=1 Tax=Microcoleus sp. FACHB-672 TaxID=2692825 RepID=UPI0016862966|nr:tetratricopeptide repeat protein [Microcoleus sp. FACHB-672]MBD2040017.1 hypothetical protein [Microcoleus sp. FACHB-672]